METKRACSIKRPKTRRGVLLLTGRKEGVYFDLYVGSCGMLYDHILK